MTRRRFLLDRSGVAAIEFAIVGPIFFAMVFAVLEMGWMMSKIMMLERSVDLAVREMRIGRPGGFTHDYVKERICTTAIILSGCSENLLVELTPTPLGAELPGGNAKCMDRGGSSTPVVTFDPGKRSELVFLRACYVTDPLTPGLGLGLHLNWNPYNGYFIVARTAFLNEPS